MTHSCCSHSSCFFQIGFRVGLIALAFAVIPLSAEAAPILTYRYDHHLFSLDAGAHPEWRGEVPEWFYNGAPIEPLAEWRSDGDGALTLPAGVTRGTATDWNTAAIAATIHSDIAAQFDRPAGSVTIRSGSGGIVFDGIGLPGRSIDVEAAALLTVQAIEDGIADVWLPVNETQPEMTVSSELRAQGIQEVVTVGESVFAGSPLNRQHNIGVGVATFNAHLIPQGSVFSFNEVLGPVDASTGYRQELVIKGDRTVPDYGGGLCQVSTTAYRGIWEYGFPIEQRRNHSYIVSYYGPQGTDATIYPPAVDMKFLNDSPGALLIQTYVDWDTQKAYFIYYGTRDDRTAEIVGPYTWDHVGVPSPRTEYTTDLAPGQEKTLGHPVPGMKSAWYRTVQRPGQESQTEEFYSIYEARPLFTQIGVAPEDMPNAEPVEEPSWFLEPQEISASVGNG